MFAPLTAGINVADMAWERELAQNYVYFFGV